MLGFGQVLLYKGSVISALNRNLQVVTTTGDTSYGIAAIPPSTYAQASICVTNDGGTTYTQNSGGVLPAGGTLRFLVGYMPQAGWVQTIGGDVYARTSLVSSIPTTATNPFFSLSSAMGAAGMVSYGTSYDFSLLATDQGETQVSAPGWLVPQTTAPIHFFEEFRHKLDVPGTATTLPSPLPLRKPACTTNPCIFYTPSDMTTDTGSPWVIGATEKMIVMVNGNTRINSPITITPGGFFALISNGNMTIDSAVGGAVTSTTPTLEGIYIATNTTHTAVFTTGDSGNSGTERLIVQGSVIADTFLLTRDLGATSNETRPAEQFIFNPELLFTMPEEMKKIPYIWQEVAP
jgi:hypothetical protein